MNEWWKNWTYPKTRSFEHIGLEQWTIGIWSLGSVGFKKPTIRTNTVLSMFFLFAQASYGWFQFGTFLCHCLSLLVLFAELCFRVQLNTFELSMFPSSNQMSDSHEGWCCSIGGKPTAGVTWMFVDFQKELLDEGSIRSIVLRLLQHFVGMVSCEWNKFYHTKLQRRNDVQRSSCVTVVLFPHVASWWNYSAGRLQPCTWRAPCTEKRRW